MKKSLFALSAIVLLFAACKKDDDADPAPAATKKQALTTGKWRLTASTSIVEWPAPVGTQTTNLYQLLDDCERDNLAIFNADNSVTMDEGPTKCDASDPQVDNSGKWSLANNDTQLTITDGVTSITSDIITLDNTTLKIRYVTNFTGIKTTTETTYNH